MRLFVATAILCTFLVLGVLAYAIWNTNVRVDNSVSTIEDGVTCVLGSIAGREGITRPTEDDARAACRTFLLDTESVPITEE